MKIHLHEIKEEETSICATQDDAWVRTLVTAVDEAPLPADRPTRIDISLRKLDDLVVTTGRIKTQIGLLCSRCGTEFTLPVDAKFTQLFCQDPVMSGVAHLESGKPAGQVHGVAHGFAKSAEDVDSDVGADADITYLTDNWVDLGAALNEQLRLAVPFQPLCKEDCEGPSASPGASQTESSNPFAALRNFQGVKTAKRV